MTKNAIREQLRSLDFVSGFTDTALHQLAQHVEPKTFACNEELFQQGEPRQLMAILISGAVSIEKNASGRPIRLVTLSNGEAVGEGILLDDSAHGTRPARCRRPTRSS